MKNILKSQKIYRCHEGEIPIFSIEGIWLYAGGWSRNACPLSHWAVIDLTGTMHDFRIRAERGRAVWRNTLLNVGEEEKRGGPWLSFPIHDFCVPNLERDFWEALTMDVAAIMRLGIPVLVACEGGHGRTGMVVAILAGIIGIIPLGECPVEWIRDIYCASAVESDEQIEYIYEMLELGEPPEHLFLGCWFGNWRRLPNGSLVWMGDEDGLSE